MHEFYSDNLFICICRCSFYVTIYNMPSKVLPSLLSWLDNFVFLPVPVVNKEYIDAFRKHHKISENREDERNYELIVPDSEERVCSLL